MEKELINITYMYYEPLLKYRFITYSVNVKTLVHELRGIFFLDY